MLKYGGWLRRFTNLIIEPRQSGTEVAKASTPDRTPQPTAVPCITRIHHNVDDCVRSSRLITQRENVGENHMLS